MQDTLTDRVLTFGSSSSPGNWGPVFFTPDEQSIIGVFDGEPILYDLATGNETVLGEEYAIGKNVYDISPDGKWLLCSVGCGERSNTIDKVDPPGIRSYYIADILKLHALNLETGVLEPLHPINDSVESMYGRFSPEGSKISYLNKDNDALPWAQRKIYVQDFPFDMDFIPEAQMSVGEETPAAFAIAGNFPNPFNPVTTISFSLDAAGHAGLAVYNLSGQLVRKLVNGDLSAGAHDVVWDGCDDTGVRVSSGVYIARLSSGTYTAAHRMTFVK